MRRILLVVIFLLVIIGISFHKGIKPAPHPPPVKPPSYDPTIWNASVTRPVNSTTYTPSAANNSRLYYTISISCTATIGGAASGKVAFQWSLNGGSTWFDGAEVANSNTVTLAIVLNSVTVQTAEIMAEIPAGALCRMNSTSTGTTTITYVRGTEVNY